MPAAICREQDDERDGIQNVHGRVCDSPIIGAGLFVDNEVGAAVSSGVGEEVIRICGTHLVIELMRLGRKPALACYEAVMVIVNAIPQVFYLFRCYLK